jgi:predicted DNA-binding transcriptional regulator YafY
MAPQRTERLLNLVIALVATRRWLTKEQIRGAVPQYAECESTEAFDRMFERDKEDLRDLGVPLVTGTYDHLFGDEPGYRIDRAAYALPEIEFTASELAVLGLASRVWQQASLAGSAARAMTKLRALGVETDSESLVGVEPRVRAAEPAFDPLYAAARDRAAVRFRYRKPDGETSERRLQPWALTSRGGHWYVVGLDTDRGAARSFRLSRITGPVRVGRPGEYEIPPDVDVDALTGPPAAVDDRVAVLRVRGGRGTALRLRAAGSEPADAGWDRLEVRIGDLETLAELVATHGPDVVAVSPPDLRDVVVALLRGARDAHAARRVGTP